MPLNPEFDTPARRKIFLVNRDFQTDLARLRGTGDTGTVTNSQNLSEPAVQPEPGTPLPNTGQRGTRVKIPNGFRQKNSAGQTWGIDVQQDEIRGGTDVTDGQLLQELEQGLRELGFVCLITDALREQSEHVGAPNSRHKAGKALDIGSIGPASDVRRATMDHPTLPDNPYAVQFVSWLINHGYTAGSESGQERAVLFGSGRWNRTGIDHRTHIHISIR
jgi:hypothetical protein